MHKIFVRKTFYENLPDRPYREPRERFTRYYNDLSELEKCSYEYTGQLTSQYNYAELGDVVLQRCEKEDILNGVHLLIACYWSHEFDPDYSFGAYFCEKYQIKAKMFDICDQGILSPIAAIKIIQCYMKESVIENALLLCFDQIAIPLPKNYEGVIPKKTSALGLYFQKIYSEDCLFEIERADFYDEKKLVENNKYEDLYVNTNLELKNDSLNCAEIFYPIFINDKSIKNKKKFLLDINDIESNNQGFICGKIFSRGKKC